MVHEEKLNLDNLENNNTFANLSNLCYLQFSALDIPFRIEILVPSPLDSGTIT